VHTFPSAIFSNAPVLANINFIFFALHCFFVKYDDIGKTTKSSKAHITRTFEDLFVLEHCIKFVILSNIKTPYLIQKLKRENPSKVLDTKAFEGFLCLMFDNFYDNKVAF